MGNYCWMRPMYKEEPEEGEIVSDLLSAAGVTLLLLLSTCSQLLLSQGHLLLHVGDLLLGPLTVFLRGKPNR